MRRSCAALLSRRVLFQTFRSQQREPRPRPRPGCSQTWKMLLPGRLAAMFSLGLSAPYPHELAMNTRMRLCSAGLRGVRGNGCGAQPGKLCDELYVFPMLMKLNQHFSRFRRILANTPAASQALGQSGKIEKNHPGCDGGSLVPDPAASSLLPSIGHQEQSRSWRRSPLSVFSLRDRRPPPTAPPASAWRGFSLRPDTYGNVPPERYGGGLRYGRCAEPRNKRRKGARNG